MTAGYTFYDYSVMPRYIWCWWIPVGAAAFFIDFRILIEAESPKRYAACGSVASESLVVHENDWMRVWLNGEILVWFRNNEPDNSRLCMLGKFGSEETRRGCLLVSFSMKNEVLNLILLAECFYNDILTSMYMPIESWWFIVLVDIRV